MVTNKGFPLSDRSIRRKCVPRGTRCLLSRAHSVVRAAASTACKPHIALSGCGSIMCSARNTSHLSHLSSRPSVEGSPFTVRLNGRYAAGDHRPSERCALKLHRAHGMSLMNCPESFSRARCGLDGCSARNMRPGAHSLVYRQSCSRVGSVDGRFLLCDGATSPCIPRGTLRLTVFQRAPGSAKSSFSFRLNEPPSRSRTAKTIVDLF